MIGLVRIYLNLGWTVSYNMHLQLIFSDPDGGFFALNGVSNKEIEYIDMMMS